VEFIADSVTILIKVLVAKWPIGMVDARVMAIAAIQVVTMVESRVSFEDHVPK
jgi:hypothetical protein